MKLLTTFESLATITASSALSGFPVDNVKDLDPMKRWRADAYVSDESILVDFGSAKSLTAIFLNQANFAHCHVQGNATDSWASPSFDQGLDLVLDSIANRKGWFNLAAFNFRWMRILIPSGQTLDNTEATPALGNLIVGTPVTMPLISSFEKKPARKVFRFETDSGGLTKTPKGRQRHTLTIQARDTLANIEAMNQSWTMAVIFADLGSAAHAWLVYPPEEWSNPIGSVIDSTLSFSLEEKP